MARKTAYIPDGKRGTVRVRVSRLQAELLASLWGCPAESAVRLAVLTAVLRAERQVPADLDAGFDPI